MKTKLVNQMEAPQTTNQMDKKSRDNKALQLIAIAFILTIVLSLIVSLFLNLDMMMIAINVLCAAFAFGKLYLGMTWGLQGWKIRKTLTILGIPLGLFIVYCILSILLGTLLFIVIQNINKIGEPNDFIHNILGLSISIMIALIATIILWYTILGEWIGYLTEYEARYQLKEKGYSKVDSDEKVKILKERGIIQ